MTFGDDLGGLIFLFTRGGGLSFPYRSDSFQFIERERLRALMNLQSYRKDAGIQFEANYFFLETGD